MVPYTMSGSRLHFVANSKSYSIDKEDKNFNLVAKAIKDGLSDQDVVDKFESGSVKAYVQKQSTDRVKFENGFLYVDGKQQAGIIAQRLNQFADLGLPITHLLKFVENLENNPSYNSRQQLYKFLEYNNIVLTDDGHFLAYKSVRKDYMDWHSNSISNKPGTVIKMDRRDISDDPNTACHRGLHVGAIGYVKSFGGEGSTMIIVKVNPANVVSVPHDCSAMKCRVCEYLVLSDASGELQNTVYTGTGQPYDVIQDRDDLVEDQDFEDYDEYDEDEVDSYTYEDEDYEDDQDDYDSEIDDELLDLDIPPVV